MTTVLAVTAGIPILAGLTLAYIEAVAERLDREAADRRFRLRMDAAGVRPY